MTKYVKRNIEVTISLGEGKLGDRPGKDITLTGLRASCVIDYVNAAVQPEANIRIYGLPLPMINQLTGTGFVAQEIRNNNIFIKAGDEGGAMSLVFQGQILRSCGQFQEPPNAILEISSAAAIFEAVRPVKPRTYSGGIDALDIVADIAEDMKLVLDKTSAKSVMMPSHYLPGTNWEQLKDICEAANLAFSIEIGKLVVWNKRSYRTSEDAIKISPETGMIGYPIFSSSHLELSTIFNPNIFTGCAIDVTSDITMACGKWAAFKIIHELESETPNGKWFTRIACSRINEA